MFWQVCTQLDAEACKFRTIAIKDILVVNWGIILAIW